jgi:eukaryotic-like serine/threonine-protein kinase
LVWLDSAGQTHPIRAIAAEYYGPIRSSPDGTRFAVSIVERGNANIWVYEWERDTITRLTFTPGFDGLPVWSPDGKHIAFTSRRAGMANLYWMRADGAGKTVRLTESKNIQSAWSFSPDGKRLAFQEADSRTNFDLWTLPFEEVESDHPKPGKPEPFLVTPFNEFAPMISPDGRWLAYYSNESGRDEVYVRPFPGPGGKWQVSIAGGDHPVWSRKKAELFYRGREGMMVASFTANVEAFAAGKPRLWAANENLGAYFALAPDGTRFALLQPEEPEKKGPTHVMFLLNFFDELRRRAPPGKK